MKRNYYAPLIASVFLSSIIANAQSAAVFSANFYNPCGGDGSNEFLTGYVPGPSPFDPTKLYYFVSGVGVDSIYQDAFCSSMTATGNGSSACNAAGWTKTTGVGGASWRILNYANSSDQPAVNTLISRLNNQLSLCSSVCSDTFIAPDATTGLIPAGARFIFFISQANNDTMTYSPNDLIDFCNLCGAGPIYVIVASFPPGNSGLIANTGSSVRYVSIGYDMGGSSGVTEIYSYTHQPPASSVTSNTYLHFIPQDTNAVNNTLAVNLILTGCSIVDTLFYPLSLKLMSFTAMAETDGVLLKWRTATPHDVDHFEMQRSFDGIEFSTIGTVEIANASDKDYSFKDHIVFEGKLFYRLQIKEKGSSTSYSQIVSVQNRSLLSDNIYYYPNPATSEITVTIPATKSTNATISVMDMTGRLRQRYSVLLQKGINKQVLPVKILSNGTYCIKINNGNNETQSTFTKIDE